MKWLIDALETSIGKKLLMALTGLCFVGFLAAHLAGNLTIYGGPDAFNAYAHHLHSLGVLLKFAELGLLALALVHVITGMRLFLGNLRARPTRYKYNSNGGGRTIGSATMPYTGLAILLFVIWHLLNFHFVDKTNTSIYAIVSQAFSDPIQIGIYVVAMVIVALHVSHGFWSLFQTLGANHPKYMPLIRTAGLLLSIAIGAGFGFIPVFVALTA